MANSITGFGPVEWTIMMGAATFSLQGADTFAAIWPADISGPKPAGWPNRVAALLPPGSTPTVGILKELLPSFGTALWRDKPHVLANMVEIHAVVHDLRVVLTAAAINSTPEATAAKFSELQEVAGEFQKLLS